MVYLLRYADTFMQCNTLMRWAHVENVSEQQVRHSATLVSDRSHRLGRWLYT